MTGRSDAVRGTDQTPALAGSDRPMLLFFTSQTNGRCRRAEGFLAQVLQRFRVLKTPTLMVVANKIVRATLVEPRGCDEIQAFLSPWLH
jgi:hypothetical protein